MLPRSETSAVKRMSSPRIPSHAVSRSRLILPSACCSPPFPSVFSVTYACLSARLCSEYRIPCVTVEKLLMEMPLSSRSVS